MQYSNKSALKTPIINRVVYLNKQLAYYGRLLPHGRNRKNAAGEEQMTVDIRRCYFYPLLEKAGEAAGCKESVLIEMNKDNALLDAVKSINMR